MLSLSRIF